MEHLVSYHPGLGTAWINTEYQEYYGSNTQCGLFRVWNLSLAVGTDYELSLDTTEEAGHQEIRAALLLTGGSNEWLARTDAIWEEPARQDPGSPGYRFTVEASGSYALVVFEMVPAI